MWARTDTMLRPIGGVAWLGDAGAIISFFGHHKICSTVEIRYQPGSIAAMWVPGPKMLLLALGLVTALVSGFRLAAGGAFFWASGPKVPAPVPVCAGFPWGSC